MDIAEPIKSLGTVDVEPLRVRILAQEESAWYEQKLRQNEYDVHRYTESIVLVFTDGSGWPNIEVSKQPGWGRLVEEAFQHVDWNTSDIDFSGRGWDRGLRGIEFHNDEIYIAASDELFVYNQDFQIRRSFRNPYLKHCHEICKKDNLLFLTSTGYDSILVFDLSAEEFIWGPVSGKTVFPVADSTI